MSLLFAGLGVVRLPLEITYLPLEIT